MTGAYSRIYIQVFLRLRKIEEYKDFLRNLEIEHEEKYLFDWRE